MWVQKSAEYIEKLRTRNLKADDWLAMQIDGVFIGNDCCVIVAVGFHEDGRKEVLDFEPGASENFECAKRLCERLAERGFGPPPGRRLLVVRDGSKAVKAVWPDCLAEALAHAPESLSVPESAATASDSSTPSDSGRCSKLLHLLPS